MSIGYAVKLENRATDSSSPHAQVDQASFATLSAGQGIVPTIVIPDDSLRAVFEASYAKIAPEIAPLLRQLERDDLVTGEVVTNLLAVLSGMQRSLNTEAVVLYPVRNWSYSSYGGPKKTGYTETQETAWIAMLRPVAYDNPWWKYTLQKAMRAIAKRYTEFLPNGSASDSIDQLIFDKTKKFLGSDELIIQVKKPEFMELLRRDYINSRLESLFGKKAPATDYSAKLNMNTQFDDTAWLHSAVTSDLLRTMLIDNSAYYNRGHKFSDSNPEINPATLREYYQLITGMTRAMEGLAPRTQAYPLAHLIHIASIQSFWTLYADNTYIYPHYTITDGLTIDGWSFKMSTPTKLTSPSEEDRSAQRKITAPPSIAARTFSIMAEEAFPVMKDGDIDLVNSGLSHDAYKTLFKALKSNCRVRTLDPLKGDLVSPFMAGATILPLNVEAIRPIDLSMMMGQRCAKVSNWDASSGEVIIKESDLRKHVYSIHYDLYDGSGREPFPFPFL